MLLEIVVIMWLSGTLPEGLYENEIGEIVKRHKSLKHILIKIVFLAEVIA